MKKLETREQAEARALELFPIHEEFDVDRLKSLRDAYLQGWDDSQVAMDANQAADEVDEDKRKEVTKGTLCVVCEKRKAGYGYDLHFCKECWEDEKAEDTQNTKLREAAEKVVVTNHISSIRVPIEVERAIEQLEKALK